MAGVVLVGGSGGIGKAVAQELRDKRIPTFLVARDGGRLEVAAREVSAAGYATADATKLEEIESAFAQASTVMGGISGVAHCVGSILLKPAHLTSEAEFASVLSVNLTSAFLVLRTVAKTMPQGGSLVLFSSAAGRIGLANHEAIAAAKAGIIGLTLSAAATYSARGLRVNCVAPGLVQTPLSEKITSNAAAEAFSRSLHPLGRLGVPSDISKLVVLLLSEESSWITGQVFGVDGGLGTLKTKTA